MAWFKLITLFGQKQRVIKDGLQRRKVFVSCHPDPGCACILLNASVKWLLLQSPSVYTCKVSWLNDFVAVEEVLMQLLIVNLHGEQLLM